MSNRTANRQKLKDFYKSRARENAELIRQPEINLDSAQFSKERDLILNYTVKLFKFSTPKRMPMCQKFYDK